MKRSPMFFAMLLLAAMAFGVFFSGNSAKAQKSCGRITPIPARALFFDTETDTLWIGGAGKLLSYNLTTGQLQDHNIPSLLKAVINSITKWRGMIIAGSDGEGLWLLSPDGKTENLQPFNTSLEDYNDIYHVSVDPRPNPVDESLDLLVATRGGLISYDGTEWAYFDLLPPDGTTVFHTIAYIRVGEGYQWMFGSMDRGSFHLVSGIWERLSSDGLQHWDPEEGWFTPFLFYPTFPDAVRDIQAFPRAGIVFNEVFDFDVAETTQWAEWAIVGDQDDGTSGVAMVLTGNPNVPLSYWHAMPQSSDRRFSHLTAISALSMLDFVVTNWHPEEKGGAYLNKPNTPIKTLHESASLDVEWIGDSIFVAASDGVFCVPAE